MGKSGSCCFVIQYQRVEETRRTRVSYCCAFTTCLTSIFSTRFAPPARSCFLNFGEILRQSLVRRSIFYI
ncbi:unnamed protein product [Hermetia illucens]|uniref:Uncharacterized protein n=1 Tax=Hermetia illucens TaxID=343691 RepID=A0A7R8V2R4_HERIL|nr:unnamed protein product [Hermetia illucens]